MARTTIVAQQLGPKYPVLADINTIDWTIADYLTDGNQTLLTGKELILARNTSPDTDLDVILTSSPSARTGRAGTITKEVPFGEMIILGPLGIDGWIQTGGFVFFNAEDAGDDGGGPPVRNLGIEFAVVRLG